MCHRAIAAACLALVAAACAPGEQGPERAGGDGRAFLSIGTAPQGGAFYQVGGAIAETLNRHAGGRGWQVTAEATKGSQENIRRLERGELDLALANSAITYFALRGESGWKRPHAVRAVMTLAPNIALFLTPAGSGLRTVADLEGQRVVIGPAGAGFEMFVGPILAAHGVGLDDLSVLHNSQFGAVDMLADGSAAAALLGGAVPTASITQACTSQDVFFVPFAERALAELVARYPFFEPATIPGGTYRGQAADFHGLDVGSMHLISSASADEDLIYELTRAIYENREEIVAAHRAGRAINPSNVVRDTGAPFHPGAIRYYREIGIWPDESEASSGSE